MRSYENQPSGTIDELRRSRREAPEPERRLLRSLKEAFPDLKWRHQSPVGPFRVDVLCFSARLVIEVDGETHAGREDDDARRTAFLVREGYRVLRFANAEVMENVEGVLTQVSLSFQERKGGAERRKGEDDSHGKGEPA